MRKDENRKEVNWKILTVDAVIVLLLIAFDQFTKYLTIQNLKGKAAKVLIQGVLELQYLENRGSAFGMFDGQKLFILAVDVLFMAVILFFLFRVPADRKFFKVHLLFSLIIAGGIGNMVDRLRFDYVVDFISFVLINYPIFNVADIYIVVAAICLFVLFVFFFQEDDLAFLDFKKN